MLQRQLKLRLTSHQEQQVSTWLWHLTGVWNWAIKKIEADANDANGYEGLGRVSIAAKNYREAVQFADRGLELDNNHAGAYYVRGMAMAYLGDFTNSASSLQKSLELNPNNGYGYYQLGMVQYRQKRYDQTIRNFQKFIELMPEAPEADQVKSILRTIR